MSFSPQILTLLVLLALGLAAAALFLLTSNGPKKRPMDRTLVSSSDRADVVLEEHARAIAGLQHGLKQLAAEDARIREALTRTVQRVGLVRYDAFDDMGGRLSFSLAVLDDHGDGVVITSINGRQDTRVYSKPVGGGTSSHNLSEEEAEAIGQAMSGSHTVSA